MIVERQKYKHMEQNKEEQKKLLTEIMEADAKDGLYKNITGVDWLLHMYKSLPKVEFEKHHLQLFAQAKEMEEGQKMNFGELDGVGDKRIEKARRRHD